MLFRRRCRIATTAAAAWLDDVSVVVVGVVVVGVVVV